MSENNTSQELETQEFRNTDERISTEVLAELKSTSDVAEYFETIGAELESFDDYGSGFELIDDERGKESLVKVPFVIVSWQFSQGDYGWFVTAYIITQDGRKLILNDGSTGIRDQLRSVQRKREERGQGSSQKALWARKGLRVSAYKYVDPATGKETPAKTFYLG